MTSLPSTMRAWQYHVSSAPMPSNLTQSSTPLPPYSPTQLLIQNHASALNAIDYKVLELGLPTRLIFRNPFTPGLDICGRVVATGSKVTKFAVGDVVYGALAPTPAHGSLAQFVPIEQDSVAKVPEGVKADDMVAVGVVGLTSYAALKPYIKSGDKVFINGGSGGTGVMAIQIAKALGAHVTVSTSGANADLVRSLGADAVLDYKKADIVTQLKDLGVVFDHVVDNVGAPANLYRVSTPFLKAEGKFVLVGLDANFAGVVQLLGNKLSSFLAWGKREFIFVDASKGQGEAYEQLARWMQEGKLKAVIDSAWEFGDVQKAYERLRTGRARGKVVVHIEQ